MKTRTEALALLHEYTDKESLLKHALCVEAAMRGYAKKLGNDEALFGITGLLHDFDYQKYPDPKEHTVAGGDILKKLGYPDDMIQAIYAHNECNGLGVARDTILAKTLFACDELCGFITAVALVRPSKSLMDLTAKSVRKKFKEKSFAAAVSRDDMIIGAQDLEIELNEHISNIIESLKPIAKELELDGTLA